MKRVQFNLRLTPILHRKLAASAKANDRSLNRELVHRLEQSLHDDEVLVTIRRGLPWHLKK